MRAAGPSHPSVSLWPSSVTGVRVGYSLLMGVYVISTLVALAVGNTLVLAVSLFGVLSTRAWWRRH